MLDLSYYAALLNTVKLKMAYHAEGKLTPWTAASDFRISDAAASFFKGGTFHLRLIRIREPIISYTVTIRNIIFGFLFLQ